LAGVITRACFGLIQSAERGTRWLADSAERSAPPHGAVASLGGVTQVSRARQRQKTADSVEKLAVCAADLASSGLLVSFRQDFPARREVFGG